MSQAERDRLVCLKKASEGLITRQQAALELDKSERQVYRLLASLKGRGDAAVMHGLRGQVSNRRISGGEEQKALEILRQPEFRDFGPTLASQYLARKHGVSVSKETMRKWMIGAGLWRGRKQRIHRVHVWRQRRERYGELVQWDTSTHDWLEGRGELRYLITMIDDATDRVLARFVRSDSTEENMAVLEEYLRRFGRPLEFYTDKASIFQTTPKVRRDDKPLPGDTPQPLGPTQIGRALQELNVGWIPAHSPQAKGRVERSFKTAQDRLIKLMRVAGVKTLEEANSFLEAEYLPDWHALFTEMPASADDAHRPLQREHDLTAILCRVEQRVVTNDYTIRFDGSVYQIDRQAIRPRLRGARVRVEQRRNGELAVRFEDAYLQVSLCEAPFKRPAVSKRLPVSAPGPNAGGKSKWMTDFFRQPGPSISKAIAIANATS